MARSAKLPVLSVETVDGSVDEFDLASPMKWDLRLFAVNVEKSW
jgi:hypothetical protein